ncbi:MAG: hypothetical protein DDT40_01762 [candidate division WS2 bacterium]|nr:hypothetical protein [Candidatus Psychracetigena formicireducens]
MSKTHKKGKAHSYDTEEILIRLRKEEFQQKTSNGNNSPADVEDIPHHELEGELHRLRIGRKARRCFKKGE